MTRGVFRTRPLGSTPFPASTRAGQHALIDFPTAPEGAPKLLIIENAGLDVDALRTAIAGDVVVPGDAGYDAARVAWNLAVDQRPAAVVLPESAGDVVAAVRAARAAGLRVAAQGTGHNAGPLGDLSDTMLVKTERMRGVSVDAENRRVRVDAGVTWGEVVGPVQEHGLAALAGSSHDVGVVGYTLGGGLSWLARSKGLVLQQRPRDRDRPRRRPPRPLRRAHRARPVLGAARRRRLVRRRHRDRARAVRDPRGLRGHARVRLGALGRGAARVERVAPDDARRGHLRRPHPPGPAAARDPRARPRPPAGASWRSSTPAT